MVFEAILSNIDEVLINLSANVFALGDSFTHSDGTDRPLELWYRTVYFK